MPIVLLALGTNLGDRVQNLREAVKRLAPALRVTRTSAVYETEPWGVTNQAKFLNMAVMGETELAPEELLRALKEIERALGRMQGVRYGPRVIDLDILFYDDLTYSSETLEIPHPRLAERRFVLVPLAEIAPQFRHPAQKFSIQQLLDRLADDGSVKSFMDALPSN